MISIENVSYNYGDTIVVDDVKLNLPNKGIISLVGPNGAGKSTLLSLMSRLLSVHYGTILLDDLDVHHTSSKILAKKLSILRQDNHINAKLTIYDLVSFGRYPHSGGRLTENDYLHIENALHYLNLQDLSHRFLDEISGGQRQRAFVAMVLCQDTPYVFLDEPLNNMDMTHSVAMMQQLRKAADEIGKTFVLVMHDINFASCYSDFIVAMKQGKIIFQGKTEDFMNTKILKDVYDLNVNVHDIDGRKIAVYY